MNTKIKIFIFDKKKENLYEYIKFSVSNKKIKIDNSIISIDIEDNLIPIECQYYYYEQISLVKSNGEESCLFNASIYLKEENNIGCFINENFLFSFEIIYYDKSLKLLPNTININNKIKYSHSDNFGLKSCRRFSILNCSKKYLQSIDSNIAINNQYLKGSFLITIQKGEKKDNIKVFKIRKEYYNKFLCNYQINDIKNLEEVFKFLQKYHSCNTNIIPSNTDNDNDISNFIKRMNKGEKFNSLFIEKFPLDANEIEKMDKYFFTMKKIVANPFLKSEEKYDLNHLKCCFYYLLYKFFKSCKSQIIANDMIFKFISFYNQLYLNNKLDIKQKLNLIFFYYELKKNIHFNYDDCIKFNTNDFENEYDKDTNIPNNIKTLKSNNYLDIEYQKIRDNIEKNLTNEEQNLLQKLKNQKNKNKCYKENKVYEEPIITFLEECKDNSPYSLAIKLLKNIIMNMTPNSQLFEILFFAASGTGNNKIEKEIAYKLSLLSEKKIKNILINLIPKYILRESQATNYNAYYSSSNRILLINENNLFNFSLDEGEEKLILGEDLQGNYTIPLLVLFMHEICGHANHAFREKVKLGIEHSPTNITIKNNNDFFHFFLISKGESGRAVEFYISQFEEVIAYLKYSRDNFPELLDYNLWIKNDLSEINQIVIKKIILNDFSLHNSKISLIGFPVASENEDDDIIDSDEEYNFSGKSIITFKTDYFKNPQKKIIGCI